MERFEDNLWICDGPQVTAVMGFHYPTRMIVIRLADGRLWIWSPVALGGIREKIDALGAVGHIVQPTALHDTWLGEWQHAYPEARLWRPFGETHIADPAWGDEIAVTIIPNRIADEAVFFHRASGMVMFCDLLQQMPRGWYTGWRAVVARLDLMTGDEPQVPRKFRLALRPGARDAIRRIMAWSPRTVLMAHGTPVHSDAPAFLQGAFGFLRLDRFR